MSLLDEETLRIHKSWQGDYWLFARDCLNMRPARPLPELCGKIFTITTRTGRKHDTMLFDKDGLPCYFANYKVYKKEMFLHQDKAEFKLKARNTFTWQQTLILTAYQRAISTFDTDSFDIAQRYITSVSGHGIGKTCVLSCISLHFLIGFIGSQIGVTANTEAQLKDIFLKEFYYWHKRIPEGIGKHIDQLDDHIKVVGEKDWFLRASVARPERPEALAGLHGRYVLILVDEASGVHDKIFEVMKGALTGDNYIVIYTSNGTRGEGEFRDSHKVGQAYTQLQFSSIDSPIVKDGYVEKMANDYGEDSEEYAIRVLGQFPKSSQMDEKGWMPLFANVPIRYEAPAGQILMNPVFAIDPAGQGRDRSIGTMRDELYMKIVLEEATSTEKDLAGKIRTSALAYQVPFADIGIDAFGIGAKVLANLDSGITPILADKPRTHQGEDTSKTENPLKPRFNSWKSEMAWEFMLWLKNGGKIITSNPTAWKRELEKMKFKRDLQGRICLMDKTTFKKEYGFSPDRFDSGLMTFFKEHGTKPTTLTPRQLEEKETLEFLARKQANAKTQDKTGGNHSSM